MTREVRRLNELLGAELGRVNVIFPLYKWIWSEAPELLHPMRNGQDYVTDHITGLVKIIPMYTLRKMCLTADQQWVLCHWIESPPEDEWRRIFGYELEWPKGGQYYPTNVTLDPGQAPDDGLTDTVISCIRECRKVSAAQVEREGTEALNKKEAAAQVKLFEEIREECTTFDHVPGRKDQVSYPALESAPGVE